MNEYVINIMVREGIERAIKIYGLEGTEEKIKNIYKKYPLIQNLMLEELWKKIKN